MKKFYPIQVIEPRFQIYHVNPRKIQMFGENRANMNDVGRFAMLVRRRVVKLVSDGNKITKAKV